MANEKRIARMREEFQKRYPSAHIVRFFEAPGQVNLLGDHMDYNAGFVLSCCVERSVIAGIQPNDKGLLRLYFIDQGSACECPVEKIERRSEYGWANQALGVAWALKQKGIALSGFDLIFENNIPGKQGLAAPAAVEAATGLALTMLLRQVLDPDTLAFLCGYARTEFLKAPGGITEQLTITHAVKGQAVFMDCRGLKHEPIAFGDKDVSVAVFFTAGKKDLPDGLRDARQKECESGVKTLIDYVGFIRQLRDISVDQFETLKFHLPEKIMKRCGHVVYENVRVLQAQEFLRKKRFKELGKLMNESHRSLKDLFEASTPELDFLTETARANAGVHGSRLSGSGPGACAVALLDKKAVPEFEKQLAEKYREKFTDPPAGFATGPADGVHEIAP